MAENIGVIGTGYVGLVSGTCFAATGNQVTCVDIVEEKVKKLRQGISPIFEPGLERLLKRNIDEGRLSFTTQLEDAVKNCPIIFLCLPTPPNEDGSADLQHVMKVAGDIADILIKNGLENESKIIINKSTVPVGTGDRVEAIFEEKIPNNKLAIVSNPEFLREGFAVDDALKPERIVVGTSSPEAAEKMKDIYAPFVRSGNPVLILDRKSAEVTKYAANSFLATKISFMNDLSRYCEAVGADIEAIRIGMGTDSRIGKRFLFPGIGYGGSCFPKDVRALMYSSDEYGTPLSIIRQAHKVNQEQAQFFIQKILDRFDGNIKGKKIALWGLAFKPNTDDTREAPAFQIIDALLAKGASIVCYDPEGMENTKMKFGDKIEYSKSQNECLPGAAALIIATEWNIFRNPDFDMIKKELIDPIIFDGRNLYNLDEMEKRGFEYYCIGRRAIK
jgi:UDPglucose 6-dehydrogenase